MPMTNEKELIDHLISVSETTSHKAKPLLKHLVKQAEDKISAED